MSDMSTGDRSTSNRGTGRSVPLRAQAPEASAQDAQRRRQDQAFYKVVLEPMWTSHVHELVASGVNYRHHLLALECLRQSRGPGPDVVGFATLVRDWGWLMNVERIRKLGKPTRLIPDVIHSVKGKTTNSPLQPRGGFNYRQWFERSFSLVAAFDFTDSISIGIQVISAMVPLLEKLQYNNALTAAANLPPRDQSVGSILQSAGSADRVVAASREALTRFRNAWDQVLETGEQMARIADDLQIHD